MSNSIDALHVSDADPTAAFGAQQARSVGRFLVQPFRLVLAMQPQRERQAARIVEQFGGERFSDALERRSHDERPSRL